MSAPNNKVTVNDGATRTTDSPVANEREVIVTVDDAGNVIVPAIDPQANIPTIPPKEDAITPTTLGPDYLTPVYGGGQNQQEYTDPNKPVVSTEPKPTGYVSDEDYK